MGVAWRVDDRPIGWYTRIYLRVLWWSRGTGAFEGAEHTLRTARRLQRRGNSPPTPWTRLRCRVRTRARAGMTVWSLRPRRAAPRVRVLYLHGGGYVHPLTRDYWRLARALTGTPAEVVVPAYPLAPDANVDDVLPLLHDLVTDLSSSPLPVVVMGDSAGGALSLVVSRQAEPPPAAAVCLCPWLDATLSQSEVSDLEVTDPILDESGLRAAGRWWAGRREPDDPSVSPLFGDPDPRLPVHFYIGDRDILRPAIDAYRDRAEAAGSPLVVNEVTAMFHVWMTRAIPEGARTRRALVRLLRGCADQRRG